jgi:hypothetical protein
LHLWWVISTQDRGDEIDVIGARTTPSRPHLNTRPLMLIATAIDRTAPQPALGCHELEGSAAFRASALQNDQRRLVPEPAHVIVEANALIALPPLFEARSDLSYRPAKNDGVDTRTIQAYLGHKDIRHTVCYTELSPVRFKGLWKD